MLQTMGLAAFAILAGTAILVTLRSGDDEPAVRQAEDNAAARFPAGKGRSRRHLRVVR